MIINHNMGALNANRQMGINQASANKSMEKLSSGLRINKAGDDAAGLAISEKMRGQIRGLDQASANAQDGISMIQTAEGALNETHSILQRMRELSVQAGNDTNTSNDREEIQKEVNQLTSEINRIGNTTEFNNQKLLNSTSGDVTASKSAVQGVTKAATVGTTDVEIDGVTLTYNTTGGGVSNFKDAAELATLINNNETLSAKYTASASGTELTLTQKAGFESSTAPTITGAGTVTTNTVGAKAEVAKSSLKLQVGANENQTMTLEFSDMRANALGLTGTGTGFTATEDVTDGTNNTGNESGLDVTTSENAGNAVTKIQDAINTVSAERSKLGAYQNRLEHTINNLGTSSENLTSAESRIRDVDMAKEMSTFSKNNILSQAAQAMLAQANNQPQQVLQLLK